MSSRYESRKFHRSPKVSSPSCQILPSISTITSKQLMSPIPRNHSDSYQQGCAQQLNYSYSHPILNSLIDKINILQTSIRQQKSERLDEYTKLLKMIKQMQCKHSSIIYDSEIRFNKANYVPQLYSVYQTKDTRRQDDISIKKVSSYVFEKSMPHIRGDNNLVSNKNLRKSEAESSKVTQSSENQLKRSAAVVYDNPQKVKQSPNRNGFDHKNNLLMMNNQQFEKNSALRIEQKINFELNKRMQNFEQQITNSINRKLIEIKEQMKLTQSKLYNQIVSFSTSTTKSFQQNFAMYKQSVTDTINNLHHQITEMSNKNMNTNSGSVEMEQVNYKMQEMYGIFNEFSVPLKQKVAEIETSLGHFHERIDSLRSLTEVDNSNSTKRLNQIENYFTLKMQSIDRQTNTLQNNTNKVFEQLQNEKNKRATEVFQTQRRKQQYLNLAEQRLVNKFEQLKILTVKDLQQSNLKTQQRLVSVIQKHVDFIENYLKSIQEKQKFLFTKYFTVQEPVENRQNYPAASTIPRTTLYVRPLTQQNP